MSERLVASIELLPLIRKMIFTLIILEIIIFSILSGIHWNWVFGGSWGFENSIPINNFRNHYFQYSIWNTLELGIWWKLGI